ncbi:MAG: hypothetical protein HRU38_11010 [Saccharospirillaceae bacterium]|nr:hypothetical protein [Saccharospirillaceae bacterium]
MDNRHLTRDLELYLADLIEGEQVAEEAGKTDVVRAIQHARVNLESLLEKHGISGTTTLDNLELPFMQSDQMEIIEPHDESLWITAIIEGRWVNALVLNNPEIDCINHGRISQCTVGKRRNRDLGKPYRDEMGYCYNRGLNFDDLPEGLLNGIIAQLETLPLINVN